ncbi:MAG: GNAT family N-acetyltransferase [Dehalococcoidia bacterium]
MPKVRLQRLDSSQSYLLQGISVSTEQQALVSTPDLEQFLAEAHLHPTYQPFGIYDGDDLVGLVSVGAEPGEPLVRRISLLVIDQKFQRRGFGRAAMNAVIATESQGALPGSTLTLGVHSANRPAQRLYSAVGFAIGNVSNASDELVATLHLTPQSEIQNPQSKIL